MFSKKAIMTCTPHEAREYEKNHPQLKLDRLMMHLDGTDTYEILPKKDKSNDGTIDLGESNKHI